MAEVAGVLILEATIGGGIAGLGTAATSTIVIGSASISLATVVGTAAILGASIGLQYALASKPNIPRPEDGSIAVKQSIPPRIKGYGVNKLAGYFMLNEVGGPAPATSYDVQALHAGQVDSFIGFYLSDDPVTTLTDISHGGNSFLAPTYADGRYALGIQIETRIGTPGQSALSMFVSDPQINSIWTPAHRGEGVAHVGMKCSGSADVSIQTQNYPRNLPSLSCVVKCSLCWDPRDSTQSRFNRASWKYTDNPVIELIDYLTNPDGGMGLDLDIILPPTSLAEWMVEANLCDELVEVAGGGMEKRYASHGWFRFDNMPEDVIGGILSTCDGWLAEAGDGTMTLTVGVYREPGDPPLTQNHIFGFSLAYGTADEQTVNQLEISYTAPDQKYVPVQADPWRDEESISEAGIVRSQQLELRWVQSLGQSRRLADRAMMRLNALMTGTFTTSLAGMRYLGKRWVPLHYPFVSGLQDCVVEIQDAEVDLLNDRITWSFIRIEPDFIEAYEPDVDEGLPPVIPDPAPEFMLMREDGSRYGREDGTQYVRELF
jgi:hypothetical protein